MALAFYGSQVHSGVRQTRTADLRGEGYAYWADDEQNVVGITASQSHAMSEAHVAAMRLGEVEGRDVQEYGYYLVRRQYDGGPWIVASN